MANCGTFINPNLARVQIEGGIVQGIGIVGRHHIRRAWNICAAINAAQPIADEDKLLFQVVDQQQIQTQTILRVFEKGEHASWVCDAYGQRLGNPTLFSAQYLPELLVLRRDMGGKHVLLAHIDECMRIEVQDARNLWDIGYPDAWKL